MTNISTLIAPVYYKAHNAIKHKQIDELILQGGRMSAKSSFTSIEIVYNMMLDALHKELTHAVVYMKIGADIRDKVLEQLKWAVIMLGVEEYWDVKLSPMRMTYTPTGQTIFFRGADDPMKSKGFKTSKGFVKYLWLEEADQFKDYNEIKTIRLSMSRKGSEDDETEFLTILTYNPPRQPKNWINIESLKRKPGRMVLKTTYLNVPEKWLTKQFLEEVEYDREHNYKEYCHIYLGEVTGVEGLCYPQFNRNKHVAENLLPNEFIHTLYVGCDGGTVHDATTAVPLGLTTAGRIVNLPNFYYDPTIENHQPLDSATQVSLIADWLDNLIVEFNIPYEAVLIIVDSAAQDLVLSFNFAGRYKAIKVPKKDRMVDMRRVQGILTPDNYYTIINRGYIDPVTKIKLANDDMLIEEIESKVTDEKTGYPEDGNDHAIDALKYGSYLIYAQGGFN